MSAEWIDEVLEAKPLFLTRIGNFEFKLVKRLNKPCFAAVIIINEPNQRRLVEIQNCIGRRGALRALQNMIKQEYELITMRSA